MRQLRTLAVAVASAVLLMGQAVAAFACEQHEIRSIDCPGSLGHGQVPQPRRRQEGRLFDLGRYCRNHLHRRAADGCHGSALCQRLIW